MDALQLAILFHETYEHLAPSFGYETRTETRLFDPETPNGKLMVAVCNEILDRTSALKHTGHTAQEDFEHFLSYSGLWKKDQETKSILWKAYEAAWSPQNNGVQPTADHAEKSAIDKPLGNFIGRGG